MYSLTEAKLRKPRELRIHCDEAGRGPLAGPITVGCAVAIGKPDLTTYKDSKKLTKKQRDLLYAHIKNQSRTDAVPASHTFHASSSSNDSLLLTSTWRASAQEIDTYGIITAINLACRRGMGELVKTQYQQILRQDVLASDFGEDILAITLYDELFALPIDENTILHYLQIPNSFSFIPWLIRDGNHTFWLDELLWIPVVTIIKGDQKNPLISAASIVAKVERDAHMTTLALAFPHYQFEKHKGYGSKQHRELITTQGLSPEHRSSYCRKVALHATISDQSKNQLAASPSLSPMKSSEKSSNQYWRWLATSHSSKPALLLHICCAPDLSRPLHWLKEHFKLYLFRYNPNIHPRKEHEQRYSQFLKLVGLEPGDYEILEDRYDPKEFFQAMIDQKETIDPELATASDKQVLKQAGEMAERSDRCNPCYSMRLEMAARMAAKEWIPYFTSTLLISPKKKMDKLFRWGKESERTYPSTKFLRFDFPKNGGYQKANELTRTHNLRRQNYCGCGRTVPKPGEKTTWYHGG